ATPTTRAVSRNQIIVADAAEIIALEVWAQSAFDAFFNGKFDLIAFEHSSRTGHSGYDPLQTSPTKSTSFLAPLFAAALIGLRVEV
ncbi:721_t:CDS:2, partial [Acaulospora colombiana]